MNEELVYGTPSTYRGREVRWAVAAALVVGVAWGLLSAWSGWRLVWLAPAIGLFVGWVWRPVAYEPTGRTAAWAVVLLLVAVGCSWGASVGVGGRYISGREIKHDPGLVLTATHLWMFEHDELPEPVLPGEGLAGLDESAEVEAATLPIRTDLLVQERVKEMDTTERREVVAWYLQQPGGAAARASTARRGFRVIDLAWVAAGAWLAFRFALPRGAPEDEYVSDEPEVRL